MNARRRAVDFRRLQPSAPLNSDDTELAATIDSDVPLEGGATVVSGIDERGERVFLQGWLLHNVHIGVRVACRGSWYEQARIGWVFRVDELTLLPPGDRASAIGYLQSIVNGLGEVWATIVVDALGEACTHRLAESPALVMQLRSPAGRRIPPRLARELVAACVRVAATTEPGSHTSAQPKRRAAKAAWPDIHSDTRCHVIKALVENEDDDPSNEVWEFVAEINFNISWESPRSWHIPDPREEKPSLELDGPQLIQMLRDVPSDSPSRLSTASPYERFEAVSEKLLAAVARERAYRVEWMRD